MQISALQYEIVSVESETGEVISIDEWASLFKIPHRKEARDLTGNDIERILGIQSKSWDFKKFRDPQSILTVASRAIEKSGTSASEIDFVLVITSSPFESLLDQDGFRFLKDLKIDDSVVPLVMGAGCAGMARAFALLTKVNVNNVLMITYTLASPYGLDADGSPNPIYRQNAKHPQGDLTWASAATFSDGVAALVLRRSESSSGFAFYTRDNTTFGEAGHFNGKVVHRPGGGALYPPGIPENLELTAFGLAGDEIREYYATGMLLNHQTLLEQRANYIEDVARIYTHQASPKLVSNLSKEIGLPPEKTPTNAARLGNLISACTINLLYEDIENGEVDNNAEICVSVVGAGPERGAFITKLSLNY